MLKGLTIHDLFRIGNMNFHSVKDSCKDARDEVNLLMINKIFRPDEHKIIRL